MNVTLFVLLAGSLLVVGLVLVLVSRKRPERVALGMAVVIVVIGLAAAVADVVTAVGDREVTVHGTIDVGDIREQFSPSAARDPEVARTQGHLNVAEGEMTRPQASPSALIAWSIQALAPWLLAALVLALAIPVLRSAGRGDPFWEGATRRLTAIGLLLLLGIPAIAILGFLSDEIAGEGSFSAPIVEPALTISLAQLLPGVLVLVLAGIFRRGVELRDLERHTI